MFYNETVVNLKPVVTMAHYGNGRKIIKSSHIVPKVFECLALKSLNLEFIILAIIKLV